MDPPGAPRNRLKVQRYYPDAVLTWAIVELALYEAKDLLFQYEIHPIKTNGIEVQIRYRSEDLAWVRLTDEDDEYPSSCEGIWSEKWAFANGTVPHEGDDMPQTA